MSPVATTTAAAAPGAGSAFSSSRNGLKNTGRSAAKKGDKVVGIDTHVLMVPSPTGPVPTPTPMPFTGVLGGALSRNVIIQDQAAAVEGSTASNMPAHFATVGPFQKRPSNQGSVYAGSAAVLINDKPAARSGDPALTCNDPQDAVNGTVIALGTVLFG
jgi:uncharacterized Zn-binding protein involved in type VI secretion